MSNTTNARTSDEFELWQPSFLAVHVRNSVVVSRRNRKRFGLSMFLSNYIVSLIIFMLCCVIYHICISLWHVAQKKWKGKSYKIAHPLQHGIFWQPCVLDIFYVDDIVNYRIEYLDSWYDLIASKLEAYFLWNSLSSKNRSASSCE